MKRIVLAIVLATIAEFSLPFRVWNAYELSNFAWFVFDQERHAME